MGDAPSIEVLVERIANVQADLSEIKATMATRTDQAHVDERIASLTGALEKESAERKAAINAEAKEREKVAARLQVVEDRMEARKYNVAISVLLSGVGLVFTLVAVVLRPLFGG